MEGEPGAHLVSIVPNFEVPDGDRVWKLGVGEYTLGRGAFGVVNPRVSREHCVLKVSRQPVRCTVTPRSTNRMVQVTRGGKQYELTRDVPCELRHGDHFLLIAGQLKFTALFEPTKTDEAGNTKKPPVTGDMVSSPSAPKSDAPSRPTTAEVEPVSKRPRKDLVSSAWSGSTAGGHQANNGRRLRLELSASEQDEASACAVPCTQSLYGSSTASDADAGDVDGGVGNSARARPLLDPTPCFRNIADRKFARVLALAENAPPHDPTAWTIWFDLYRDAAVDGNENEQRAVESLRGMRLAVQWQTFRCLSDCRYQLPDGSVVPVSGRAAVQAAERSLMYDNMALAADIAQMGRRNSGRALIEVVDRDCLDVAVELQAAGESVAVLNMANATRPGGGYMNGAGAQEENLHRRSSLYLSLDDPDGLVANRHWKYPIPDFGAVYSPDVLVFRGAEADGYPFFAGGPVALSFVSVAADRRPPTTDRGKLTPQFATRLGRKIRMLLDVAVKHGHSAVVLSALGCGAFCAPPRHVASIFKSTIFQFGYHHLFTRITFAIIDDDNARQAHNPQGNYEPFRATFAPFFTTHKAS